MLSLLLEAGVDKYRDPFFDLNVVELFLGVVVILIACWIVAWAWRTFKP